MNIQVPDKKVTIQGLAGAMMTVVFAVAALFDIHVDADTAVACATIVGFGLAYFIPAK
jgi:hypothetical protein